MEDIALLALRLVIGTLFIGHGAQKLLGLFGGHGISGTGQFFESLGLKPGKPMALFAGLSEVVAGFLLVLGIALPLAALLVAGLMVMAILTVTGKNGLWVQAGGCEYNLVLLAAVGALAFIGPGAFSL